MNLSITTIADNPTTTLTTMTTFDKNIPATNPSNQVTLTYTNPENDVATAYTISTTNKIYVSTNCTYVANVYTIDITDRGHENGVGSFSYSVTTKTTSLVQNILFFLNAVTDIPYTFKTSSAKTINTNRNILFNKNTTHTTSTISFTLNNTTNPNSNSITSYSIIDSPNNNTLTNYIKLNNNTATDLNYNYTPNNKNLNNKSTLSSTDKASATTANLTFRSKVYNINTNNITVKLINTETINNNSEYT